MMPRMRDAKLVQIDIPNYTPAKYCLSGTSPSKLDLFQNDVKCCDFVHTGINKVDIDVTLWRDRWCNQDPENIFPDNFYVVFPYLISKSWRFLSPEVSPEVEYAIQITKNSHSLNCKFDRYTSLNVDRVMAISKFDLLLPANVIDDDINAWHLTCIILIVISSFTLELSSEISRLWTSLCNVIADVNKIKKAFCGAGAVCVLLGIYCTCESGSLPRWDVFCAVPKAGLSSLATPEVAIMTAFDTASGECFVFLCSPSEWRHSRSGAPTSQQGTISSLKSALSCATAYCLSQLTHQGPK